MDQRVQRTSEVTERTDYDLFGRYNRAWGMESSERTAMMALLQWLKPACSIEIGTREGGSLAVISDHSGKVFTLDLDQTCRKSADAFPNASFVAGASQETLPGVFSQIKRLMVGRQ